MALEQQYLHRLLELKGQRRSPGEPAVGARRIDACNTVMLGSYNAIILDSDLDSRMRLKQATASVSNFGSVHQYNSLPFAVSHLELAEHCEVIFISHRFAEEAVAGFIQQAKQLGASRDAAYIKLLPESALSNAIVATSMREGFDGFLCEPYSINSLVEITDLAARVKKERAHARDILAIKLLVQEIAGQIDIVAQMRAAGCKAGISSHALRETCSILRTLEGDTRASYFEAIMEVFEHLPAPSSTKQRMYSGPSRAILARQEKRMIEELKSEINSREKKTA